MIGGRFHAGNTFCDMYVISLLSPFQYTDYNVLALKMALKVLSGSSFLDFSPFSLFVLPFPLTPNIFLLPFYGQHAIQGELTQRLGLNILYSIQTLLWRSVFTYLLHTL